MEPVITSAQNPLVKRLKKLHTSAAYRSESNLYIAEGIHLADSFLVSGGSPLECVYSVASQSNPEVKHIIERVSATGAKQTVLADSLFETVAGVHASVGVMLLFGRPESSPDVLPVTKSAVILENVQDPGNLGTVLRTMAAVGVQTIFLSPGCTSAWSPKAIRAGMGAQFSLDIHEDSDALSIVRSAAIPSLATSLDKESVNLYSLNLHEPVVWIFGSEGKGVSNELLAAASKKVTIPQVDTSVESLNIGIAAAVCLYEHYRQTHEER